MGWRDIAEIRAAMPRCTAMSKQTRQRCRQPASPGYPACHFHGAHRDGGPIDNGNRLIHGNWSREELAARKAGSAVGRGVRAVARNALARFKGNIGAVEGAIRSAELLTDIANALETQQLARDEKNKRLRAKRSRRRSAAER